MKKLTDRKDLIKFVINELEKKFPDSVVMWCGTGIPDEDDDITEQFEALWIKEEDYERFTDLVWNLEKNYANPIGFSIMVHDLTPEETKRYRWNEYQSAKKQGIRAPQS